MEGNASLFFFFKVQCKLKEGIGFLKYTFQMFHHFILPSFEDMLQILDKYNRDVELTCFCFSGIGYYK